MSKEFSPEPEAIDLTGSAGEQPQNPGVEAAPEDPTLLSKTVGVTALSPFRIFAPRRPIPALGEQGTYSGGYNAA